MGDTDDGSSNAAHSAPVKATKPKIEPRGEPPSEPLSEPFSEPHPDPSEGGFFRRIISALSPSETDDAADHDTARARAVTAIPGLLNLRRMTVEDVMIPKAEIVAVPTTITLDDLVEVFRESGMTRLPVYEETLDTPLGMIHLKDFALQYGFNGPSGDQIDLEKMLRPLLFVPPSMPIGILLTKMQTERRHMALVIDEYGGVDGLATIEDLIEQVVGEIEDEHDLEEDSYFTRESPGCYSAQAKTPLDEFEAEIGLSLTEAEDIDEEEIDTLGGLVFMLTGRVPVRGEVVQHPNGTEFEVTDADPRRIKRLRVRLPDHAAPPTDG